MTSPIAGRRLFIGIPSYDRKINLTAAMALIELGQRALEHELAIKVQTLVGCSIVSMARNSLAHMFLESSCTDLLFIDSDVTFKAVDILKLLTLTTKFDVVAGVYRQRRLQKAYAVALDMSDEALVMNKAGLIRADRVGMGFTMIRRQVFEKLRDEHPEWAYRASDESDDTHMSFFDFKSAPEGYLGEDCLFCDRVREVGFSIWVDPSLAPGHMATLELEGSYGDDAITPMLEVVKQRKQVAH